MAFQREWTGDPAGLVRIGEYRPATGEWRFFYYPLDPVASPAGGFVGLSEIVAVSGRELLVLERDNVGRARRAHQAHLRVSIAGIPPQPQGCRSRPVQDAPRRPAPALRATGGWTQEKVEGLAVPPTAALYAVTDNDGVDENTGETQFFRLGNRNRLGF